MKINPNERYLTEIFLCSNCGGKTMSAHKKSMLPGLLLIIFGVILLINRLAPYHFSWRELYPLILIGLGVLFFASVFNKKNKGAVFPGTILLLLGLFFFIRNYFNIGVYGHEIGPVFLIVFGLAFFAVFITKPSDWGVLIPAGIFLFLGAMFWLRIHTDFYWDVWDVVADYWPVILIIIGGAIILSSLKKKQEYELSQ